MTTYSINHLTEQSSVKVGFREQLLILLLFIFGLNIPSYSSISLLCAAVITILLRNKIILKQGILLDTSILFLFSFLYISIGAYYKLFPIADMKNGLLFVGSYLVGYFFAQQFRNIKLAIMIPLSGFVVFAFMSTYTESKSIGTFPIAHRSAHSYWSPDVVINGPVYGIYFSLGMAAISLLFTNIKLRYKMLVLLLPIMSIYGNSALLNRTPMYIGFIVIISCLSIYFFNKKLKLRDYFAFSVVLLLLFYVYNRYTSFITNSDILQRIFSEELQSSRYTLWKEGFVGLIMHPLGGLKTELEGNFTHNFWLDIGNYVGVFPVILIIVFQIRHASSILKLIKANIERYLIVSLFIAIFVSSFVEPVLIASPVFVAYILYVCGYLKTIQMEQENLLT
ncbi:hypothetical protein [Cohnella hashimotonis]|uniref:O-antigen ligase domain-containing protein n=1 Tax=Cohnella hashimotonis TaxID=2826895 RepID=A0ABT6TTZ7_9BACL|nr:hypothetical protein [Cohnella hashimotonis]MDI4650332.1 hypothetical protein [Cohnella hashimotonis]